MGEYEEKESKAKWKEIAQGALPAGPRPEVPLAPGTPIVVLQQSAALPPRIETRASLDQKYTELPGVSASPLDDAIKETLNNIRQNSTLRFAAIPVFVTIFGALAAAYYTVEAAKLLPAGKLLLPWLGLFTATWFGVVEAFLSRNLILWWSALLKDKKQGWEPIWAHRHANEELTNLLRLVLFLPYAAAIGFWVSRIELITINRPWALLWGAIAGGIATYLASWLWYRALGTEHKKAFWRYVNSVPILVGILWLAIVGHYSWWNCFYSPASVEANCCRSNSAQEGHCVPGVN